MQNSINIEYKIDCLDFDNEAILRYNFSTLSL